MALRYGSRARPVQQRGRASARAPMVHATARTDHPVRQGLYGIFEVFVDTILVCTSTGLVVARDRRVVRTASPAPRSRRRRSRRACRGVWGDIVVTTGIADRSPSRPSSAGRYYGETGDRLPLRHEGRSCPTACCGSSSAYLGAIGLAAPGVGRRRHPERPHGAAEPRGPAAAEPGGRAARCGTSSPGRAPGAESAQFPLRGMRRAWPVPTSSRSTDSRPMRAMR